MAESAALNHRVRCRFDHVSNGNARSIELSGFKGELVAWDTSDVREVLMEAEQAVKRGCLAAGFVSYEGAPGFQHSLAIRSESIGKPTSQLPLAWFGLFADSRLVAPLPGAVVIAPAQDDDLGRSRDNSGPAGVAGTWPQRWSCEIGPHDHAEAVVAIQSAIAEGETYLVNYTTRFRREWLQGEDPFDLYQQLVTSHSSGFHGYIETGDWAVACGSPELFFELSARRLTTRPMKGTIQRGRWREEDERNAEVLKTSVKERAENVMVVDLIRNDLGRLAKIGTVSVPELWHVERHPALWQLTSTVEATLREDVGLAEVFGAMFPCGSVTGAPKVSTMEIIARLEHSRRGLYCGAVGLIQPDREIASLKIGVDARFSVAIRTAVVHKILGIVEYGSGGGITADSSPLAEWEEVMLKARAVTHPGPSQRAPSSLLETMLFDPSRGDQDGDGGIRHLHSHLVRMSWSASILGFTPPGGVDRMIIDAVTGRATPARVRVLLHRPGELEIELSDLEPVRPEARVQTLCIDMDPVSSSDMALFHKTVDRERYDRRSTRHPAADDVILVNERGEITETTRSNLAFRIGPSWFTPALECGLLPGIEREIQVRSGFLTERIVTVHELCCADEVATISSLRGWRPASVRPICGCAPDRAIATERPYDPGRSRPVPVPSGGSGYQRLSGEE